MVRRVGDLLVVLSLICEGWSLDGLAVVTLSGGLPRVRTGAVRLSVVSTKTVPIARVVVVHLPSAQVGVVLPGAVRAGTEVVASSGARDPMLL